MDKSINISDRNFHSRITGKYHKGKRNPYDFPLMIFFKNPGQLLSQKINFNVLLQFNISKNITAQHILKSAEGIKSLLEWFRIERYIPKHQKFSSLASRSKDIPVFMSFAFEKISSALNRIIYPLFFNSEKTYFKSHLQTFNQIQQIDHIKKYDLLQKEEILSDINLINTNKIINNITIINGKKILKENLLNRSEDISSADNSVSWDYKFVFHNESPVILQHVNLLLRNSKLANYLNYPEVLNDITKSITNKSNAYFSNYIQIINHGLHPGFEPVILQHVNLLLNSMSIQGDSLTSKEYFNFSKLDNKYHVILPHVNLLLNTISANNIVSYTQEFSKVHTSGQRFDYSFQQADLKGQEFAGDKKIYFTNAQLSNNQIRNIQLRNNQNQKIHTQNTADHYVLVYNFPAVLQQIDTIQKNMPEMILSHSKSFPTSIKHDQEKNYHMALSVLMPSIIKPVLKDDTQGQTSVNLEHLIKSDTSTEASTENHDLQFKTNRKIQEEIENVKRIAQEAKQTVIESVKNIQTSHEEEMNRKININQLSDQVYRLLDRKITIEKERRGYI